MKRVFIAGAAGFLGSHLVDYYLSQEWQVVGVDNVSTGSTDNLKEAMANQNFSFLEHDIVMPLPEAIVETKFDLVFSFACPASPPKYQKLALETLHVSSIGVERLINLALKHKARLVHASTSEVYGDPMVHPQPESYWGNANSYGPRSMYDEGKRYAEALLWVAQHDKSLNAGIVRIFNTYGPRMAADDGRVVSALISEALKNEPLTLHGDGNQSRSFCYVSDLIKGIVALADSSEQAPVNLGNPKEFTIIELAERILSITKSRSETRFVERPQDDPSQRQPDLTRAKQILGWQPEVELEEGLVKTIDYFYNIK